MPDSITISNSFAQDIKLALDDALRSINVHETDDAQKAIGGIVRVRAELVNVLAQNSTCKTENCVNIHAELDKAMRLAHGLQSQLSKISHATLKKVA